MGTLFNYNNAIGFLTPEERDQWISQETHFVVLEAKHKPTPVDAFGKGKWIFKFLILDEEGSMALFSMQDGNPGRDRLFAKLADFLSENEMYGPCYLAYGEQYHKGFKRPIVIKDVVE